MDAQFKHYQSKLAFETDSWDLKVALDAKENIVVIDARSPEAFAAEHIPGAINIPHRQMTKEATASINKDSTVVTYCDGIGCNASTKGALAMTKLGFRVKELIGGIDWWRRDGYPTSSKIIERIKSTIKPKTVIPKPEATAPFVVKCWGTRRGQAAMVYHIPNHVDPSKPHEKGVTESEFAAAYAQLLSTGELTRAWFTKALPGCAKEGACNFTTVGGIFELLGEAKYSELGVYKRRI